MDTTTGLNTPLNQLRRRRKLTLADVASKLDVPIGTVGAWFSYRHPISEKYITKIAEILRISPRNLIKLLPDTQVSNIDMSKFKRPYHRKVSKSPRPVNYNEVLPTIYGKIPMADYVKIYDNPHQICEYEELLYGKVTCSQYCMLFLNN